MAFGTTPRRELLAPNLDDDVADLAIVNGRHVNVNSGEIVREDVAIEGDRIAYVGDVDHLVGEATEVIDAEGRYLTPGLIDAHIHSYHSYINGTAFARYMLGHGVTAYADGFYGQAVVGGLDAVELCKRELEATPLRLVFLVPCIAHHQQDEIDHPPANPADRLTDDELFEMLSWDDCYGLEEPTPGPILTRDETYLDLFEATVDAGKVVTGHAAGLSTPDLNAYAAMGARTDHEMVTDREALEWLRRGIHLLARDGSGARDVPEVVKVLTEHDTDDRHLGFSSDVLDPGDLMGTGAIDQNVREAIGNGVDPVTAVQAATLANAEALRVDHELGSIAPGKVADVLLVDDLVSFDIDRVVVGGEVVVYDDEVVADLNRPDYPDWALDTIDLPGPTSPDDFTVTVDDDREEATVRTIVIEDGSLITEEGEATLAVRDGEVQPDVADDVLKAASVDRHEASGRVANAFVEGYGLDEGAFAISVNSQRQNVSVIGTSGAELSAAVDRIAELDGGMVVVRDGEVLAEVPLRLFGLQSVASGEETMARFEDLYDAIAELGCDLGSPITNHEFINMTAGMASIRLSDYGLFDAITGEEFAVVKD